MAGAHQGPQEAYYERQSAPASMGMAERRSLSLPPLPPLRTAISKSPGEHACLLGARVAGLAGAELAGGRGCSGVGQLLEELTGSREQCS